MNLDNKPSLSPNLVWFRRDLRTEDHAALSRALQDAAARGAGVYAVFVLDTAILAALPRRDLRVAFIHASLLDVDQQLQKLSSGAARLLVLHGAATYEIPRLALELGVAAVYANHDDEPQAVRRDAQVAEALRGLGCAWYSDKDHVIFERQEVLTQTGKPYTVFTPYKNAWLKRLHSAANGLYTAPHPIFEYAHALQALPSKLCEAYRLPSLADIGFEDIDLAKIGVLAGSLGAHKRLADFAPRMARYHEARDYPAIKGPSYLSVHLRFGTVSIRRLVRLALAQTAADVATADASHSSAGAGPATWLSELIWRDFYHQIMANFPHAMTGSFKPEYDRIVWEQGAQADALYAAWCEGRTGYPLVDAAMRQLNQSGYMHNRLRMVVASFLTKDIGLDWRWGERYFAQQLIDFDLAANNGGWQWAASSGCDAQPYFRIFNPTSQSEKFDPQGKFIKRYVPELAHLAGSDIHAPSAAQRGAAYPAPIVDHAAARLKTLERYAIVKR